MRFATQLRLLCSVWLSLVLIGSTSQFALAEAHDPTVVIETSKGTLAIRVFLSTVPYTARNFLDLVQRGFYNGLTFHRVETWCIQGGDPNGNGSGHFVDPRTGRPRFLKLEINNGLKHNSPGVVAMARSNNPNSASCQFYITKAPMPNLDGQYAIFGGVTNGMETVFRIRPGDRILRARIIDDYGPPAQPGDVRSDGRSLPPPSKDSGF